MIYLTIRKHQFLFYHKKKKKITIVILWTRIWVKANNFVFWKLVRYKRQFLTNFSSERLCRRLLTCFENTAVLSVHKTQYSWEKNHWNSRVQRIRRSLSNFSDNFLPQAPVCLLFFFCRKEEEEHNDQSRRTELSIRAIRNSFMTR